MGSTPQAPAAPDPVTTANAQTGENVSTAVANAALQNINQTDQYGDSSTYSINGYTPMNIGGTTYNIPQYSQSTVLGPQQQAIYNQAVQAEQNMAGDANTLSQQAQQNLSNPVQLQNLNLGAAPAAQQADLSAANINNYINTSWEQPFNNMAAQQQEQLNQQLASQGITMGGSGGGTGTGGAGGTGNAYANAQYNLGQNLAGQYGTYANDMYGTAANAILGQTQANNSANLAAYQANVASQEANNQSYNQNALTNQNQPINQLDALLSGSQVQNPSFTTTPVSQEQIPTTDYAQIAQNSYQDQLSSYNAQVQAQAAQNSGLFGLGGSILGGLVKLGGI